MYSIRHHKTAPEMDSILGHQKWRCQVRSSLGFGTQPAMHPAVLYYIHYNGALKLLYKSEFTDYLLPSGHVQLSNDCGFLSFQLLRKIHMPNGTDHTFTFLVCQTNDVSLSFQTLIRGSHYTNVLGVWQEALIWQLKHNQFCATVNTLSRPKTSAFVLFSYGNLLSWGFVQVRDSNHPKSPQTPDAWIQLTLLTL